MRTQKNGLVRRTVTLTQELTTIVTARTETTGREFSAELRYLVGLGLLSTNERETLLARKGDPASAA